MNPYTVALADDHVLIRNGLAGLINSFDNYKVLFQATNGLDLIDKLSQGTVPDIILLDINMPKMDGLQFLAAMKASEAWRGIPVVMITTEGGETKVGEAVKLGAAGYVRKPFTADQIKEKLAGILEPALPL